MSMAKSLEASSLADILERILDKGIVVAGDISVSIASVELLTIKIRLVICSVDKAREIGINWWQKDPALSSGFNEENEQIKQLKEENVLLKNELMQKNMEKSY